MRPVVGSLVGAVGGLAFVEVNAGGLATAPGPGWVWPVRVLGVVAFLAVVWLAVVRPWRASGAAAPPSRAALRTYAVSVGLMVVAFVVGANLLRGAGLTRLVLPWVVLVVGLHFLPLARAFHAPVFVALGLALAFVGVLGGLAWAVTGTDYSALTGVAAGFVLLWFSVVPALPAAGAARPA